MKRFCWTMAGLMPLLITGVSAAVAQSSGYIKNTRHNFGANGYSWADGQICKPCHTPHNTIHPELSTRLWAHYLPQDRNAAVTYKTREGDLAATLALDGYSMLCMSCHDGTVALGDYVGSEDPGVKLTEGSQVFIGTDLMNDHPVGLTAIYELTHLKPYTVSTTGSASVLNANQNVKLPLITTVHEGTTEYVVSCKTCHNPHGTNTDKANTTPFPHLLRLNNAGSDLCLTCHVK